MNISICLDVPDTFINEVKYTIENLFFPYNDKFKICTKWVECKDDGYIIIYCNENSVLINEAQKHQKCLYIILEDSTVEFFLKNSLYNIDNVLYEKNIPCLFPLRKQISFNSSIQLLPFDIIASSYFFLTCWQELAIKERDNRGRIPLKSTIQYKLNIIRVPIVNEYLRFFENQVEKLWGIDIGRVALPHNKKLYVSLSHDIDYIDLPFKKYLNELRYRRKVIRKSVPELFDTLKTFWNKKDIFRKLIEVEARNNVSSTNLFFSHYDEKDQLFLSSLFDSLKTANFEIGHHIHDKSVFNNGLSNDREEFDHFGNKLLGERVHALSFEVNDLFEQLEKNDYSYDNSLLFAEDLGYRTGFTYPHYIFNHKTKRPFKTLAIPLNVMETTLVEKKYLGLDDGHAFQNMQNFVTNASGYGGVLSVLFHHSFFWINTRSRLKSYEKFLEFLVESDVKVGTCCDIYLWYKELSL